ncbi:MAG: cytochrome c [Desulfocapsaceae bacterium]|nr:cytochrome c [Desulfocapsaceae bacterium]
MKVKAVFLSPYLRSFLFMVLISTACGCSQEHPGEDIYRNNCSQCHAMSGQGLRKLYPSLDKSLYLSTRIAELPCLIIQGSKTAIKTTERRKSSFMPPIKTINTAQMLLLIDYLQQRWATGGAPVSEQILDTWLSSCST